ncbi:replication protein RepA [Candidatus Magnetaquicoccus inordinatus]|uniref:replication protein RepA n=1 Tax=Candidatus Magnetaquicoccus inordinatus TaxID=2496818 RepID=UPI00102AB8DC|nr:replication protein RepA [Candidatus Magnetaquicoccus inordinatus]
MNTADIKNKPSSVTMRVIDAAVEIAEKHPLQIEYQHGLLCQVFLPRRRPVERIFERQYQQGSIRLEAGALWNGRSWVDQPLPAGAKPRLALIHISAEAVKRRSRIIEVDHSARQFMERLGLNTDGGSSYALFRREMMALAACRMCLGWNANGHAVTINTQPIETFEAWMQNDGEQRVLWPGVIELSQKYFDSLVEHAVPLDPRALRALAHSSLAIDVYSFLARRLHVLKKPVMVPWTGWKEQFGHEYKDLMNFKNEFKKALKAALEVYRGAKVEAIIGGLLLKPSLPPVHYESVAVSFGLADHVRRSLPVPDAEAAHNMGGIAEVTIKRFRSLYPRLDVYACKAAFDAWLETGKAKSPANYDSAFLGFARKWAIGKG